MIRPPDEDAQDIRPLWPLVRLFGILADIAAQKDATGQGSEAAAPREAAANLIAGDTRTVTDVEEDSTVERAA